ncbi:hypothetical protein ACWKWP_06070 [Agromyces soli]
MASSVGIRRASLAAVALASVFLLSACAPGTAPVEDFSGLPSDAQSDHSEGEGETAVDDADADAEEGEEEAVEEGPLAAAWLEQGGKIAVTTFGSSSCPVVGTNIKVVEPAGAGNTVEVSVEQRGGEVCTMDYVPHTTVFWTPMNVTTTEELTVKVTGEAGGEEFSQQVVVPIK